MNQLVEQGPLGQLMANIGEDDVVGIPDEPSDAEDPTLRQLRPLNLLMVGALYPQVAQMLGLYVADTDVAPGQRYDYAIVADHLNLGNGNAVTMWNTVINPGTDLNLIDIWITFDHEVGPQDPLDPPAGLRGFALPGSTRESPNGSLTEAENNAGLVWDLPEISPGVASPRAPVLHWIRRASLGMAAPDGEIPIAAHSPVAAQPHAVTEPIRPDGEAESVRSPDWPPLSLHYIDSGLAEGWYSYRVNSIDIFGRWSPASDPAEWWQWEPAPTPSPWYFDANSGDAVVNLTRSRCSTRQHLPHLPPSRPSL